MSGDIIILHKCTKNHDHVLYFSWDMARDTCNCYFSFWVIFCLFTPLTAQKLKFQTHEKNPWRYHHFAHAYRKLWLDDVSFLRYGAQQTDGRTDRWKKWDIEVGVPPKDCDVLNDSNSFLSNLFLFNLIGSSKRLYNVLTYLIN